MIVPALDTSIKPEPPIIDEEEASVNKQFTVPVDEDVLLIAPELTPPDTTPVPFIVQVDIVEANVLPFKSSVPPELIVNEVFAFPHDELNCMVCPFWIINAPCQAGAEVPDPSAAVFQFVKVFAFVPALTFE